MYGTSFGVYLVRASKSSIAFASFASKKVEELWILTLPLVVDFDRLCGTAIGGVCFEYQAQIMPHILSKLIFTLPEPSLASPTSMN